MAYDESLAKRIDLLTKGKRGFSRKDMFGGVGYMLHGNMCVGVHRDSLIIRYDPDDDNEVRAEKDVSAFDLSGRPMKGWSLVGKKGLEGIELKKWFDRSYTFVQSLPPKK